jgi:hypothetical protein
VPGRKEIRLRLFTFYAKCGQASTNPLRPACGRQAYAALREQEKFYQWTKALLFFPIVLPYFYGTDSAGAQKHSYSIFLLTFRPAILRGKLPLERLEIRNLNIPNITP